MFQRLILGVTISLVAVALSVAPTAQTPGPARPATFAPDWTFKGSALTGTEQIGEATWRAENGEIVGTPKSPDGGWLVINPGYQDVQVAGSYRCAGACNVGVMVRSEKTSAGIKGIYKSLAGGQSETAAVAIDPQGRIAAREPLTRPGGAMLRIQPPPPPQSAGGAGGGGGGRGGGRGAGPASTFVSMFPGRGSTAFKPDDWNTFEVLVDANVFRASVNAPAGGGLAIDQDTGTFGPIALYVGGTGEVRFKNLGLKDLQRRVTPTEKTSSRFRAQRFEDFYYGWSAAAGDFNHDGVLDVTIANRYYLGPTFTDSRELYLGQAFNPAKEYGPAMVNYAGDFTGDGWDDILVAESRAPALYVNPRGESRRWTRYTVFPEVISESITFKDVNNDGKVDAIFSGSNKVQWATSDPANPTGPWKSYAVSEAGPWGGSIHGIGAGDINGDGRVDLIAPHGWWEQPAGGATVTPWTFHQGAFGRNGNAGANMEIYDVNGDKLPDVVTSLAAHGFGLAWYEQKRDGGGAVSFIEHQIMGDFAASNPGDVTFSELHALTMADIDGDGVKDIITGKRAWAHLDSYSDPDAQGAAVLYWFKTIRDPKATGGARFVPELIHNRSGVGSMIEVADLNKDGAIDIMAATIRGGFIFWNTPTRGARGSGSSASSTPAAGRK
jgi:3-keto-disaccharide hydrolase/VCBS repeat protein/FG-GAP repeat protein